MARPGLTQHRKFLRLARALGSAPLALGCLELMWEKCYQNGEPYLGDDVDVEAAAQWPGAKGELCRALLEAGGEGNAGFIEPVEDRPGHFQCHDLYDHAPEYVAKRLKREVARREKGVTLHELRVAAGRMGGRAAAAGKVSGSKRQQTAGQVIGEEEQTASKWQANGEQVASKRQQIARTPAPAPAPSTSSLRSEGCAELPAAPPAPDPPPLIPPEPPLLELPCVGSQEHRAWPVTQRQVDQWAEAYPGVDVLAELRKARAWLEANPRRGKTYRGMASFAVNWLSQAQNRPGPRPAVGPSRASPGASLPPGRRCASADAAHLEQLSGLSFPTLPAAGAP